MKLGQKCYCPRTGLMGHVLTFNNGSPIGITPDGQRFTRALPAGNRRRADTFTAAHRLGKYKLCRCHTCGRELLGHRHAKHLAIATAAGEDVAGLPPLAVYKKHKGRNYCQDCLTPPAGRC